MLLEFRASPDGHYYDPAKAKPTNAAFALVSQITDLCEFGNGEALQTQVGLRSGRALYVLDPIVDILDALSFVTRYISVTPGIVDKVDGEREEMYPWRRRETVAELARKWRAHTETLAKSGPPQPKPVFNYDPPENATPPDPLTAAEVAERKRRHEAQNKVFAEGYGRIDDVTVDRNVSRVVVKAPVGQSPEAFARSDAEMATPKRRYSPAVRGMQPATEPVVVREVTAGEAERLHADGHQLYVAHPPADAPPAVTYERFTDRARKAMQLATQAAWGFNHEYVGTEHVLIGLIKEGYGVGVNVLRCRGIDPARVLAEVEKILVSGPDKPVVGGRLPLTPRSKKVMEYAIDEARNLDCNHVGTEHMLLGLLRETAGVAAQVLMNQSLTLESARETVLRLAAPSAAAEMIHPNVRAGISAPKEVRGLGDLLPAGTPAARETVLQVAAAAGVDPASLRPMNAMAEAAMAQPLMGGVALLCQDDEKFVQAVDAAVAAAKADPAITPVVETGRWPAANPPRAMTNADRYALTQDELETLPPGEAARLCDEYVQRENITNDPRQ